MALMQSLFTLQQPIYTTESDMRRDIVTPVVMKDDSNFVEIPIVIYGLLNKNFSMRRFEIQRRDLHDPPKGSQCKFSQR